MTPEEKAKVEEIKKDPKNRESVKGKTDEEILAASRFMEDGDGIEVYDSEEAWRAARKKRNTDEIEEV